MPNRDGGLAHGNFIKPMTTHANHTIWQGAYHAQTPAGIAAYIKVTGYADGSPPVIQFKEKDK